MRSAFATLAAPIAAMVALGAFPLAGCGDGQAAPKPDAMVGNYLIDVEANGMVDKAITMTVSLASNQGVLLDFTAGISQIRCSVVGSTQLTLPRQMITVAHAIGNAVGTATGDGTIDASGAVDITVHLATAGIVGSDGGVGSDVDYHITGAKN